jgi:WD40 repeat protein
MVIDETNVVVRAVLKGTFEKIVFDTLKNFLPKNKLTVFVSSTFTDTSKERNLLHEQILPQLQAEASKDDIQVILYDMRFGVKDENTKDHLTWEICRDAIKQCREESDGLFFLSLQSEKYGYMPLPKFIEKETLETALRKPGLSDEVIVLAKEWYLLDENYFPPRYELRNLKSKTDEDVYCKADEGVLSTLRDSLLDSVGFELCPSSCLVNEENEKDFLVVNRSVTEWETLYALNLSEGKDCSWIHRNLDSAILKQMKDDKLVKCEDLCDVMDDLSRQKKLSILKSKMTSVLEPLGRIVKAPVAADVSSYSYLLPAVTDEQSLLYSSELKSMEEWKVLTMKVLFDEIDAVKQKGNLWKSYIENGLGLPLPYFEEIIHHCWTCYSKSSFFVGRQELVEAAMKVVSSRSSNCAMNQMYRLSLGIVGKSGSGKTGLMSKIATMMKDVDPDIPVIIRYCGTSRYSLHGIQLIQSVSLQLLLIYDKRDELMEYCEIMENLGYEKTVERFHGLLSKYPVYLFIDSLDQLSNRNEARSKLSFLKGAKSQEKSRIVVSTLPDERYSDDDKRWKYLYLCERRLIEGNVPLVKVESIMAGQLLTKEMMAVLLKRRNRLISDDQLFVVINAVSIEPTILYMNLAVEVINKWRSFDSDTNVKGTVKGIIHQIFDDLEAQYGKKFVSSAFSFVSHSVEGVSDVEMQDLLSLHTETMNEVFQYSKVSVFPIHVWLRLKFVISHLIAEKENHCVKWYHRQLWETANERYESLKKTSHEIMGKYFGDLIVGRKKNCLLIHSQPRTLNNIPAWFPSSKVNRRRAIEAAFHLVEAGYLVEAIEEMCCLEGVSCAALVGNIYNYIVYMQSLSRKYSSDHVNDFRLNHYLRWLMRISTKIPANARMGITSLAGEEPFCSIVKQDVDLLIGSVKGNSAGFQGEEWIRSRCLRGTKSFDSLVADLHGHNGGVSSVSWNVDGSKIASGSDDTTIKIWDALTGEVLNTLEGHSGYVYSLSWNVDGSKIASASWDKTIKIWDAVTGEVLSTLEGHRKGVLSVSWNVFGRKIASGSGDKTIKIWDAVTGKVLITLEGHSEGVHSVSWNVDGRKVVSGSLDKAIKIWDAVTGDLLNTLEGHFEGVRSVSWNVDGSKIVSGSGDRTIKIWDAVTGRVLNTLVGHSEGVQSVSWNVDGSKISSGSWDNTNKIWDAVTGEVLNTFEGHSGYVSSVSWNVDGSKIVSGAEDKTIKIWDAGTGGGVSYTLEGHFEGVWSVSWNAEGSKITSGSGDNTVKIWDALTGKVMNTLVGHSGYVSSVSWNGDGSKIASGSWDKPIKIWDAVTGAVLNTLDSGYVTSITWNVDGSKIASGSGDKTIKIWDAATGEVLNTLEGHSDSVSSVSWNVDESRIASGSGDKIIKIWDAVTGELLNSLVGHSGCVSSVSWNVDGSKIVSASWDKTIKIWDALSGEVLNTLKGHTEIVWSISWNVDGSKIASGSEDSTVKIWDSVTGEILSTLEGHSEGVRSVSWNADGSKVASGSWDKTIRIWDSVVFMPICI